MLVCLWLQSSPGSMEYDMMGLQYETSHTTVTFLDRLQLDPVGITRLGLLWRAE